MANVFGGIRGRVDDSETSRNNAEENSDGNASDRRDVQLLDEEGPLVEEDVNDVHVEVTLAEAVVQLLGALEQAEVNEAAGFVAGFTDRCWNNPIVCAETSCKLIVVADVFVFVEDS